MKYRTTIYRFLRSGLRKLAAPTVVVVVWQMLASNHVYDVRLVPSPLAILEAVRAMRAEGFLFADIEATLRRVLEGYVIAGSSAFVVGVSTGLSVRLRGVVEPLLQIGRPIPALALVPLAISWFGLGELSKLFIVIWAAFYPIWISTHLGVRQTPQELLWTAKMLGASPCRTALEVVVPGSLPYLLSGARVGLGLSFAAAVVAEMSGADSGLGYRVAVNHQVFQIDQMLAGILIIGVLGAAMDGLYVIITNRLFPWTGERSASGGET